MLCQNKNIDIDGETVKLQIWDSGGNENLRAINNVYYPGSQCCAVVFDLTAPHSLKTAEEFLKEVDDLAHPYSTVLLGNKSDLDPCIDDYDIKEVETKYDTKVFKVSAKDNLNIEEAFEYLVKQAVTVIMNEKCKLEDLINENYDSNTDEEQKK